jgi:hypothetical protein
MYFKQIIINVYSVLLVHYFNAHCSFSNCHRYVEYYVFCFVT